MDDQERTGTDECAEALGELVAHLRGRKWKLGFAESCTGGLLASSLAALPGVSDIFEGGVVSYSDSVKRKLLGVKAETLLRFGAVSHEVAIEMAHGACRQLEVEMAISITGIAGPTGGSLEKPVGTVWICAVGPKFEKTEKCFFVGDRVAIQRQSAFYAVGLALSELNKA